MLRLGFRGVHRRSIRLQHLAIGFGGITVHPLWPKSGVAAKRVVLRARKGVASPFDLTAGLVLHTDDGDYTPATGAVLRGGRLEI